MNDEPAGDNRQELTKMTIKEQIEILVRLQEVENEAASMRTILSLESEKLEAFDAELAAFEQDKSSEETDLEELKRTYRSHEADLQSNASRIESSQSKLRAVKNNKEYQSLLKEIEDLKSKNSRIEDEMIAFLDRIETSEQRVSLRREEHLRLQAKIAEAKAAIKSESDQSREKLTRLEGSRQDISAALTPKLRDQFNRSKNLARGVAIVAVKNGVCLGCNMNIPPQMYNELQRFDSLKICPHCERIIYWNPNPGKAEE